MKLIKQFGVLYKINTTSYSCGTISKHNYPFLNTICTEYPETVIEINIATISELMIRQI